MNLDIESAQYWMRRTLCACWCDGDVVSSEKGVQFAANLRQDGWDSLYGIVRFVVDVVPRTRVSRRSIESMYTRKGIVKMQQDHIFPWKEGTGEI